MEARLAEKDAEIDIQKRELQTLRVHNCFKFWLLCSNCVPVLSLGTNHSQG